MAILFVVASLYTLSLSVEWTFGAMCSPFGRAPNGFVSYLPPLTLPATPEATIATLNCNLNHIAVGPAMAICRPNSEWTTKLGECQSLDSGRPCTPIDGFEYEITYLPPLTNKKTPSGKHISGTVGIFRCKPRFVVDGNDHTLCFDGKWSVPAAKCKSLDYVTEPDLPKECSPIKIGRGQVTYKGGKNSNLRYESGTEASVKCATGYQYSGPKKHICSKDGHWTGRRGYCKYTQH